MKTGIILGIHPQHESAVIPQRATESSACWDLSACLVEDFRIQIYNEYNESYTRTIKNNSIAVFANERVLIPTGLILDIPVGHSVRVHPRSGVSVKSGISLINCEGVIDSDYVQPLYIPVINHSDTSFVMFHGDRIAQFELVRDLEFAVTVLDQPPQQKTSRDGGFGSTGIQS